MNECPEILSLLRRQRILSGLDDRQIGALARCTRRETVQSGELLCRCGADATAFYIISNGTVAVQTADRTLQTLHSGDVLGWSWLVPPFRWTFDARAISLCELLVIDSGCLTGLMEEDHVLAHRLLLRLIEVMSHRLSAARLHLLD